MTGTLAPPAPTAVEPSALPLDDHCGGSAAAGREGAAIGCAAFCFPLPELPNVLPDPENASCDYEGSIFF